jgi:hypothetical protein
MKLRTVLLSSAAILFAHTANAQDSGFLSDYSQLEFSGQHGNAMVFVADGAIEMLAQYDSIMIDQPELFISADSKYKGMKPDTMTNLAENLRAAVTEGMQGRYGVVESPGSSTLYMRMAATNLYVKKAKRGLLSYTPAGAVLKVVKDAASEFLTKNTLVEMTLEAEIVDSTTGKILVAMIIQRGQRKDKAQHLKQAPATWEELRVITVALGARFGCRLDNARLLENQRSNCMDIPLQVKK